MSSTSMLTKNHKFIALGILLIFTALIRIPILIEPWGADQSGFGHVAKGMLEGRIPYKDFYSLTAYGIFFTFALFFKLFGMTMISIHIGHLLVSLITVVLVFILTAHLYGQKAALIAAFCYTIFSNGLAFSGFGYENANAWGTYWYLSQREVFMAPLILGAIFLTIIGERKNKTVLFLFNGMLIGLAAFYKLTAILILFVIIVFTVSEEFVKKRSFQFKKVLKRSFLLVLGFVLVQIPFVYYFWINEALKDVYEALFVHLPLYVKITGEHRLATLFSGHYSILSENLILWLFTAISCLYIIFKDRTRHNVLIALWGVCSLLMVWGQGKFFGYHFLLIVPPFAVLTGYGIPKFFTKGAGLKEFLSKNLTDIKKTFMLVATLFCLIGFGVSNYDYYKWHADYFLKKISRQEYYNVFNEFPTHPYSFRSDNQIVEYLKNKRKVEDKLGVIFSAGDTVIHFLTGMKPVTRFIQSWYLFPADEGLAKNEITMSLRKEFVDQMINAAPRFILCVHIPLNKLAEFPSLKDDPDVNRLYEFVRFNYTLKEFPDNRFLFIQNEGI